MKIETHNGNIKPSEVILSSNLKKSFTYSGFLLYKVKRIGFPMIKRHPISASTRKFIFRSCNGKCSYCGCELHYRHMQVDHVKSLHNHGKDDVSNMTASCRDCNHLKGACSLEGFRKRLKKFLQIPPVTDFQKRLHFKYHNWNGLFHFENH